MNYICTQCNYKAISYPNQICRRQFFPPLQHQKNKSSQSRSIRQNPRNVINNLNLKIKSKSGNSKLDEFIKETQLNSECCDDFIEWIPRENLESIKYLTDGGNSKVYFGTWNSLNISLAARIALKAIKGSHNINDNILNEFKTHHKCRNQYVIPFYGITQALKEDEYAMVVQYAEHGDLRNYIHKFFSKLTWADKVEILIKISKALNSLHQMSLLHRDFHCKNILVDKDNVIYISDFGLCQPINSEIDSNRIQGVLPYIAPEVLRSKPYTKRSEVYSLSMIMWELTSKEPPFLNHHHDEKLVLDIVFHEARPKIIEGTPDFYAKIMQQCWNSDPLQRPDASHLPKIFEEMMELCKNIDDNTICLLTQPNPVTNSDIGPGYTKTKAFEYTLSMSPTSESQPNLETEYETKAHEYTLSINNCQRKMKKVKNYVNLSRIEILEKYNNQEEWESDSYEQVNEKDDNQKKYESDGHAFEIINNNEQVDEKDNNQEEHESESHEVNLSEIIEQVDEKDNNQEEHESESHEVNPSEIINNDEQVEVDEKVNNQEKYESDSHDVNPPKMIVEEYHVANNLDPASSTFLRRALKKIAELVENVEYITDQAVKGRQAALRLSNNSSTSSVNTINESEKEVKKVEEEKIESKNLPGYYNERVEGIEDPRYVTQTYNFSLDDLNKKYNSNSN